MLSLLFPSWRISFIEFRTGKPYNDFAISHGFALCGIECRWKLPTSIGVSFDVREVRAGFEPAMPIASELP
jgi:hypothetical protein